MVLRAREAPLKGDENAPTDGFLFLSIVKNYPLRTMRVRSRSCPWITADLKEQKRDRNILKMKSIKSNDRNDWMRYKKQLKEQQNQVSQA